MQTIDEIRRDWVIELINRHGTIADLNRALGRAPTDATISQIKNQAPDSKTGKPKNMGNPLAREIEETLKLERGTLDHPIGAVRTRTEGEIKLLECYRDLKPEWQAKVYAYALEQLDLMRMYEK